MRKRSFTAFKPTTPEKVKAVPRPRVQGELAQVVSNVDEYLLRFTLGIKKRGGHCKKHAPDGNLIQALRNAVTEPKPMLECCKAAHSMINACEVGRVFVGLSPERSEKLHRVVEHLQARWPQLQKLTLCDSATSAVEVHALAQIISKFSEDKPRHSLCAASKLLAMLGLPVPITDSLARKALGVKSCHSLREYEDFHVLWLQSFDERRDRYETVAAERIDALHASSKDGSQTDDAREGPSRSELSSWHTFLTTTYVAMRAHDVKLMEDGQSSR